MALETLTIESNLSPNSAFERLIDLSRVPEWDRGINGSVLLKGEPGQIGTQYEVAVTGFDGQPTTAVYELTAVAPGQSFTMVGTHADFRADDTVTFEAAEDGCRVTYEAGLVLTGDNPPLGEEKLAAVFKSLVGVVEQGLLTFLNS